MSDVIRRFQQTLPSSSWVGSSLPHKPPQEPAVSVEGVPEMRYDESPGPAQGRGLFDKTPPPIKWMPSDQPPIRKSIFRQGRENHTT